MPAAIDISSLFLQEGIKASMTVCAGLLAAYFGLKIYFRQREYEIVKQRYLENSIDKISEEIEHITSIATHNWAQCVHLNSQFRDNPESLRKKDIDSIFLPFPEPKFLQSAHKRIFHLTHSEAFHVSYSHAMANLKNYNDLIAEEIPKAIKANIEKSLPEELRTEISSTIHKDLEKFYQGIICHTDIVNALQDLAKEFERTSMGFAQVSKFSSRRRVKDIVARIEEFLEKLTLAMQEKPPTKKYIKNPGA